MRQHSGALASHIGAFVAGVAIATAALAHAVPRSSANAQRYAALDTFAQALSYMETSYVEPADPHDLIYSAVNGMAQSLDAHSSFFDPVAYQRLRQDTEGEFGSVGMSVLWNAPADGKPSLEITEVLPGSPAARAGITRGDTLVAVDGTAVAEPGAATEPEDMNARLRGPAGTRVVIAVQRGTWDAPRRFELIRELVKVPTVEADITSGIGYLAISRFQEATTADVTSALAMLERRGVKVLLLDLRGNPGGLLDHAIRVADLFLKSGTIVTIRGRDGTSIERHVARESGTFRPSVPMIILVDQGTASAAEIVAAALQGNGRGKVLGLPTFGKGSIQTFFDLVDGSGLKLTTARFFGPGGDPLEEAGVAPDIHVEAFAEEIIVAGSSNDATMEDLESRAEVNSSASMTLAERLTDDYQLKTAFEMGLALLGPTPPRAPHP